MRHSKEFLPLLNILATLVHKQTLSISPSGLQLSEPWAQSFPPVRILAACAMVSTDSCTRSEAAVQGDLWDQAAESLPGGILSGSSPSLVLAWIMLLFCSLAMLLPQPDPLISICRLPLIHYIPEDLSGKHWIVLWPCVVSPDLHR